MVTHSPHATALRHAAKIQTARQKLRAQMREIARIARRDQAKQAQEDMRQAGQQ